MKKLIYITILFIFFIPLNINAKETYIDNYYIDITIEDDGDANVKELFIYKGSFNGVYKNIKYNNSNYDGEILVDAKLYSPTDIELINIKEIEIDNNVNFDYIYHDGEQFTRDDNASVGSSGFYSLSKNNNEYIYKIFSPGTTKGFYIEYTLKDVVIKHKDVSELWLNVFNEITDKINHLEIIVNLPNNQELLRSWAHGPLEGNIEIISNQKVSFKVDNLNTSNTLDIRLAFDNDINSIKATNIIALDEIIKYETVLADIANKEREEARALLEQYEKKQKIKAKIFNFLGCVWILGLLFLIKYIYKNYDKEYISEFKGKYFRDIPNNNNPALVGYLVNKKIKTEDLSASILNLINKKNIGFKKIDENDFMFTLINDVNNTLDKKVVNLLFDGEKTILLSEFKKKAKNSYQDFLTKYIDWLKEALNESKTKNYYEENVFAKSLSIIYSLLGLSLLFLYNIFASKIIFALVIILGIISFIYFCIYTRRTKEGNEEYLKWIGLKNFMNDFGKMDIKELPEIMLWEKYLVYAVTLGCANKLIKTMKIKVKEMNLDTNDIDFTTNLFLVTNMNSVITTSVNSAISTAKSIAASHNSSGAGTGGGFSSGGGFSGGGGSTGHF